MRSRLLAWTGAIALAVGGMLAVSASPAAAYPAHCSGWTTHPNLYNRGGIQFDAVTGLYDGPFEDCKIVGYGHAGEGIDVHCKVVTNSERWYYVEDTTNGKAGWASYPNLDFNTTNTINNCS